MPPIPADTIRMQDKSPLDVHIWQVREVPGLVLPENFRPVRVSLADLPAGTPVVVPVEEWESFAAVVEPDEEGHLPDAILYLDEDQEEPRGAAPFFDAVVRRGEWEKLEYCLRRPDQFRLRRYVGDLPVRLIDRLPSPLTLKEARRLPVPSEVQQLLKRDPELLARFSQAVEQERAIRWTTREPTAEDLTEFLQNRLSPATGVYVEAALKRSRSNRALYDMLRSVLLQPVANVPLLDEKGLQEWEIQDEFAERHAASVALLLGFLHARLLPRGARYFRSRDIPPEREETDVRIDELLSHLRDHEPITLVQRESGLEIDISIDPGTGELAFERLRIGGSDVKPVFFVAFRRVKELISEYPSVSGRVAVPPAGLREARTRGADHLEIRVA